MALTKIKADGLTADLIDETKLADNSIDSEHYNDGSIDNAHLADDAVGVAELSATGTASSSTFLRGDNSWAAVTSTTINNNADNRVITGSGTANTLEGESGLTYNGSSALTVSGSGQQDILIGSTDAGGAAISLDGDSNGDGAGSDYSLIRHNTDGNLEITTRNPSGATDTIFQQGTTESMRIDSSGKVGIGTTAPLKTLTTKAGSNTHAFYIAADNDATDGWGFHADSSSGALKIDRSIDNNFGYRRATFHQDGGLCFGSDTAAANALDDYEEGYWSPEFAMSGGGQSITYHDQQGYYIKVGKIVHLQCYLRVNQINANGAGGMFIANLPFTSASNTQSNPAGEAYGCGTIGYFYDWQNPASLTTIRTTQNDNKLYIYSGLTGGDSINATVANNLATGTQFMCSLTYAT